MSTHLAKLFTRDDRAVAPIIGVILLFGIFFIGFAGYQAEYVPQQNAETEFQHYQDVQNDLTVVRNAVSRAGQQNQPQFESVRLGTTYRERILAINPPAPAGTLRTTRSYKIKIRRSDGTKVVPTIPTRFLEYQNQYNELDIDLIRYENSVLYLTDAGQRESVVLEEQNLVRNDTVVITALQKPFSESSIGRATVELYPTQANSQELPSGDLNVTLPTRLSASYWNTALSEYNWLEFTVFNDGTYPGDVQVLEIKVDSDKIELNTVGISEPTEDSAKLNMRTDSPGPSKPPTQDNSIVYTDSNANLFSITDDSNPTDYSYADAQVIGPDSADLDGDGEVEIPVVDTNGNMKFVSSTGSISNPQSNANAKGSNSIMTVGEWDGSPSSVFFAGKNNKIYRANANSGPQLINDLSGQPKADAVLGIADIDDDGTEELIYGGKGPGGNSNTINYIDGPGGSVKHITNSGYGTNNAPGVGSPGDFNNDGKSLIPIVDGSNNIKLIDSTGVVRTLTQVSATKSPITTADVVGDSKPEIVYIESSKLKYISNVNSANPSTGFIRDDNGSKVDASDKRGVA